MRKGRRESSSQGGGKRTRSTCFHYKGEEAHLWRREAGVNDKETRSFMKNSEGWGGDPSLRREKNRRRRGEGLHPESGEGKAVHHSLAPLKALYRFPDRDVKKSGTKVLSRDRGEEKGEKNRPANKKKASCPTPTYSQERSKRGKQPGREEGSSSSAAGTEGKPPFCATAGGDQITVS